MEGDKIPLCGILNGTTENLFWKFLTQRMPPQFNENLHPCPHYVSIFFNQGVILDEKNYMRLSKLANRSDSTDEQIIFII